MEYPNIIMWLIRVSTSYYFHVLIDYEIDKYQQFGLQDIYIDWENTDIALS